MPGGAPGTMGGQDLSPAPLHRTAWTGPSRPRCSAARPVAMTWAGPFAMTVNQPLQAVLTQLFPGYGSGGDLQALLAKYLKKKQQKNPCYQKSVAPISF